MDKRLKRSVITVAENSVPKITLRAAQSRFNCSKEEAPIFLDALAGQRLQVIIYWRQLGKTLIKTELYKNNMAHPEQKQFFQSVKDRFPAEFKNSKVLESGSLNINGTVRDIFEGCDYTGIDIAQGRDVDIVCKTHEFKGENEYDVVISGEQFEHDEHWRESLLNMYQLVKSGGLIIISAASSPRLEHGTTRTGSHWGTSHDYYMNIEKEHLDSVYKDDMFSLREISKEETHGDIYFLGRKI